MEEEKIKYLFDASSLYTALRMFENKLYIMAKYSAILDLTFYEIGNAIITEFRRGTVKDWKSALELWTSILKNFETLELNEFKSIGEIAVKENLTFYDASYIQASMKNNLTLISDDEELLAKASNYIKAIKLSEIPIEQ
jgi:predicted nucleic acid-binding protein